LALRWRQARRLIGADRARTSVATINYFEPRPSQGTVLLLSGADPGAVDQLSRLTTPGADELVGALAGGGLLRSRSSAPPGVSRTPRRSSLALGAAQRVPVDGRAFASTRRRA
jgi:hypothetical protein